MGHCVIMGYDTDCTDNIVVKNEIVHLSNFTFFYNVFLKLVFFNVLKRIYMEERVKVLTPF